MQGVCRLGDWSLTSPTSVASLHVSVTDPNQQGVHEERQKDASQLFVRSQHSLERLGQMKHGHAFIDTGVTSKSIRY